MKKTNKQYNKHNSAFTIVELLIVIVVIAILAAITVVAYNGIQTRAYNAATISQAKQVVDLVNAYVAVEGKYPTTISSCATRDNECTWGDGAAATNSNTGLINNLNTIGTPPSSKVSGDSGGVYGIVYLYDFSYTWGGDIQPVMIRYYLKGINQPCNISNVMNNEKNGLSTTGYTGINTTNNFTYCTIHIDGPTS